MKAKGKLRQGLEDRVKTRVDKLKKRKGYYYFLSDITYPNAEKQRIKYELQKLINQYESRLGISVLGRWSRRKASELV